MNSRFFIKLAIGILVTFGLLFAGMALYPVIKFKIYIYKLESKDAEIQKDAFEYLCRQGERGRKVIKDFCRRHNMDDWGPEKHGLSFRISLDKYIFRISKDGKVLNNSGIVINLDMWNKGKDVFVFSVPKTSLRRFSFPGMLIIAFKSGKFPPPPPREGIAIQRILHKDRQEKDVFKQNYYHETVSTGNIHCQVFR
jgi:hypothetical protein